MRKTSILAGLLAVFAPGYGHEGDGLHESRRGTAPRCNDITSPQRGFWVDIDPNASSLKMSDGCTGTNEKRCAMECTNDLNLIFDRKKDDAFDKRLKPERKLLFKCRCEVEEDEFGVETFHDCKWRKRRQWNRDEYEDEFDITERGIDESKATIFCEGQEDDGVSDTWNIGSREKEEIDVTKDKGFPECEDMNTIFPGTGGEWRCKDKDKNVVDGSVAPYGGVCIFGCQHGNRWENRRARFTCMKPWIGRDGTQWDDHPEARQFRGNGIQVFRRGLLHCDDVDP